MVKGAFHYDSNNVKMDPKTVSNSTNDSAKPPKISFRFRVFQTMFDQKERKKKGCE